MRRKIPDSGNGSGSGGGGGGGGAVRPRKHITFSRGGHTVRLVKPPPRSMNRHFWFTRTESVVRKGAAFEIEPDVQVSVEVGCRMQLTSLASSTPAGLRGLKGLKGGPGAARAFLEVRAEAPGGEAPLWTLPAASSWLTVASVAVGEVEKTRVVLPTGGYVFRCVGAAPIQVFAQVWDLEERMS